MSKTPEVVEVDMAQLEGLVDRTKGIVVPEDHELIEGLVGTVVALTKLVREGRATLARIRHLLGLRSSEKTDDVLPRGGKGTAGDSDAGTKPEAPEGAAVTGIDENGATSPTPDADKPQAPGHGCLPLSAYLDLCPIRVTHDKLHPGDRCPLCGRGNLFELREPAKILRIQGQPPLVGECWLSQRLRCNSCGAVFTAAAPPEAQGRKYSASAVAIIALLRYGGGMPLYRLEGLQGHMGTPVPDATMWDVLVVRADEIKPVLQELRRLGAQGVLMHNDDTYMRILEFMGKRRARLIESGALPSPERTGLFTTGIVAIFESHPIALYITGRQHAGENLADLLTEREPGRRPPIQMCDGLDRNHPKGHEVVPANCLVHGRRHVVDQVESFPEECRYLLERMRDVFRVDDLCRKAGLSDDERLHRHQRESGPIMEEIQRWMEAQMEEKRVEPNSGLGAAIRYLLKRWDKLTLFLRVPGAPLENNLVERALKRAIRHRKNSLFYFNARGAEVGDLYMTLIHTTELNGGNAFHYLTELMRHAKAASERPGDWLPWTYLETLARLQAANAAPAQSTSPTPPPPHPRPVKPRRRPLAGKPAAEPHQPHAP
ncbi:MAG: IS66 family transposase [Deltaproteobacteria bacterium]|nr:IS66 family transposase [Deltaproteobacteria bacterium]